MSPTKQNADTVDPGTTREFAVLAQQHFAGLPARALAELTDTRVGETLFAIDDANAEPNPHRPRWSG